MRYIPSYCIKEGMKLGKNIYSSDSVVLLAKDVILTKEYIDSIRKLGINGAYIEDTVSQDIRIENVISEELRIKTVKSIKELFNKPVTINRNMDTVEFLAKNIIEEILKNKNIMVNMVDIKNYDDAMYSHSVNVAVLCTVLGIAQNLEQRKIEKLIIAALLHDLGKVFIPQDILKKSEEELTKEELEILQSHAEKGYRYVKDKYNMAATSYVAILQHHERYDGKGYPDGKSGDKISPFARMIAICNVYDNLMSLTYNKKPMLPSEAIEYIMGNTGSLFDPKYIKLFLRKVAPYPLGTIVRLSNNERAIVIENNETCSMRPRVRTLDDGREYDLTFDASTTNVTIVGVEAE